MNEYGKQVKKKMDTYMSNPDSIDEEISDIQNATHGVEVRGALAAGVKKSFDKSVEAETTSNSAREQVGNIQNQVNQLVVEGDSSVEAAQARVDADGNTYNTLKERLDEKETDFSSQLAQKASQVDAYERKADLSHALSKKGHKTVITGDSLSYNRHPFDSSARSNAYDSFPGMLSWSFMLRDAIHYNDPFFVSGEDLVGEILSGTITIQKNTALADYQFPFSGRYTRLQTTIPSSEIVYKYKTNKASNSIVLYFSEIALTSNCKFDVYLNGTLRTTVNNAPVSGQFQGMSPIHVELSDGFTAGDEVEIKLTNFVPNNVGSSAVVFFYGIGTIKRDVYLTGRGGWTSGELLADINNRILQYSPDLLITTLGANDIYHLKTVDEYKANMESIITQTRTVNNDCEIVLITSPLQQGFSESYQKPYNLALKELAEKYSCYYVDLVELFRFTSLEKWRIDNVHFTKFGNGILAKHIINLLMPRGNYNNVLIDPDLYFSSGKLLNPTKQKIEYHGCYYITWDGSKLNYSKWFNTDEVVASITKTNDFTIRVTFNVKIEEYLRNLPHIKQHGTITKWLYVESSIINYANNYVDYRIYKYDQTANNVALITASDWETSSFKFMLNF